MARISDSMGVNPADFVRGAVETVQAGGEWTFHRFLPGQAEAYREAGFKDFYAKTFATAGVRLAFRTDAAALSFDYRFVKSSSRSFAFFDVWTDGAMSAHVGQEKADEARHTFATELAPGEKDVEIHFPWSSQMFVSNFVLCGATFAEPIRRPRTMLCFGDSITQGYDAIYPSLSYAESVARLLGADPVNKGIGGDRFFPDLLRARDAFDPDFITVAYGTNDWRHCEPDDVRARAATFFRRLSELYPAVPIFAITPIWRGDPASISPFGEEVGCMDGLIRDVCAGLPNVFVIAGQPLVPHLPEFYSDLRLHPNDLGFGVYAQNLNREITSVLKSGVETLQEKQP